MMERTLHFKRTSMCRTVSFAIAAVSAALAFSAPLHAQSAGAPTITAVPRLLWFSGTFRPADGAPPAPVEIATLSLYHDESGGAPVWRETQNVVIGSSGRFNVLVGSTTDDGLPLDLFATGQARWLSIEFHRGGEHEQPRAQLLSVPYALKAVDADTLGGRPPSAYALVDQLPSKSHVVAGGASNASSTTDPGVATSTFGSAGYLGMFTDSLNLGNSVAYQNGARIGIGTFSPLDYLHISFTDPFGAVTGIAVQNRSGNANASSGMLFYDQNGALAQFQGFNNATHEYRINNIAAGGSINFLLGSATRFAVASNGNVGIGTASPATKLQVAGDVTVDGNIGAKYQDVAEWVDVASPLEPGTVVIVDPSHPNRVRPTTHAYDTRVAGAVSRQPGLVLGDRGSDRVMVAQSGRVRVKADARYGAIRIGDLLVTSPTSGRAMRSRPLRTGARSMHRPGTVLGKALEALPSGTGEILVLLTLQ